MTTRISTNNLDSSVTASFSPKISGIAIADNSYTVLDDTAVSVTGGYIIITGSNFATGCTVLIGSVVATSVSFVNSTTVRAQVPAQAAGSYTVYVTNPDGGLAIRVNGLNYSATPTWVTTSPLTSGQVNTAISIQLSATSNGNVTYALQAGSSLPAGVTLSNVGLLSGTVTGISVDTTYNFTVVATDTELQDTPQAFSITITSNDQYFKNTTLLLSANTPGATFVSDASTNAFNITVSGDTRPNNFSPYLDGYYSNFFDGTGDYINIPASVNLNLGSGNFTVECYMYFNQAIAGPQSFLSQSAVNSNGFAFGFNGSSYYLWWYANGGAVINSSSQVIIGMWNHLAVVRSGSTLTMYINGVSAGTATDNISYGGSSMFYIGSDEYNQYFRGYLSGIRIVKGTALYTSNFTPPATPPTAVANTQLLTCQSNRFIDNSTNNFAITRNGDTRIDGFVPYTPAAGTSTYGSAYFDGTGDYLTVPSSSAFAFTGSFTVEAWVYLNTVPSGANAGYVADFRNGSTSNFTFGIFQNTMYGYGNSGALSASGSTTLTTGRWYHMAWVRSGTAFTMYLNGVSDATATTSYSQSATNFTIGARYTQATEFISGYIADLRIVNGTAVYTTAFTPPTAPLTAIANTSLLTLQTNQPANNNQFVDRSTNNFLITRNGNATAGSFSPYAENWSNYFDGTGDDLTWSGTTVGTNQYTFECWFYNMGSFNIIGMLGTSAASGLNIHLKNTTTIQVDAYNNSGTQFTVPTMTVGTWYHLAVCRNSSNQTTVFLNGVRSSTGIATISTSYGASSRIGSSNELTNFTGYISNARLVVGSTVYDPTQTTITVPTTPLQPIAKTSLLTCRDANIVDDSANRFTLTRNGDVSVQKFGPFAGTTLPTPYYGAYFRPSAVDSLVTPSNAAFGMGTGNWTIEGWYYTGSSSNDFAVAWHIGTINAADGMAGSVASNFVKFRSNGQTDISAAVSISNTWAHIAWVKSSNIVTIYVNGTSVVTGTYTNSIATSVCTVVYNSTSFRFDGYISNFRVVKGQALYTTTFTPSTTPLTTTSQGATASNVSLLTCQSATFIDNSTNNFTITANGNSQPTIYNPFTVSYSTMQSYSPSVFGGSMYFDGTGDYLSVADNIALDAFTDFTIEGWVYFNSAADNQIILNKGWDASSTFSPYIIWTTGGNLVFSGSTDGSTWALLNQTIIPSITTGRWYHFAVTRSGSTVRYFNNGALTGTSTVSAALMNSIYDLTVGSHRTGGYYLNGYISDLRLIKGTAVYTSAFVPPAAPVPVSTNTVLMLRGTAAGIYDSTMNSNLETVGDARVNTSVVKFAGKPSIFFDGTGDYLQTLRTVNLAVNAGNVTYEFWLYRANSNDSCIYCDRTGDNQTGLVFGIRTNKLFLLITTNGSTWAVNTYATTQGNNVPSSQWTHIAISREGASWRVFIDGTLSYTSSLSGAIVQGSVAYIGFDPGGVTSLNGYLSDLRITKGVARYTTNFTAPTSPSIQY